VIAGQIKLRDGVPVAISTTSALVRDAKADPRDSAKVGVESAKAGAVSISPRS